MKRIISAVAFIVSMIAGGQGYAQVNDAGLWTSVTLEKKLTQRFSVTISEEARFVENISELGQYFTEAGLAYRFGKNEGIRLSTNYRYSNRRRVDDSFSSRHRYNVDLAFRKAFGPIVPIFRTRFQSQYTDYNTSETGKLPQNYSRNKLTLKYDPGKRYEPFISAELFTPLALKGGLSNAFDNLNYDNMRFAAGLDFEFNERSILNVAYIHDREFNVVNPQRNWITAIGFTYAF